MRDQIKLRLGTYLFYLAFLCLLGATLYQIFQVKLLAEKISELSTKKENLESESRQLKFSYISLKEELEGLKKILLVENTVGKKTDTTSSRYKISWPKEDIESRDSVDFTQKSILRIKDYIREKEQQVDILKNNLEQLNNLLTIKEKELSDLKTENSQLKVDLNQLHEDMDKLKLNLQSQIDNLKLEILSRDGKIKEITEENLGLKSQLEELNLKFKDLSDENNNLKNQYNNLVQERKDLRDKLDSYETQLNNLNNEKDKLKEELSFYQNQLEGLRRSKEELASDFDQLRTKSILDKEKIQYLESRVKELEERESKSSQGQAIKKDEPLDLGRDLNKLKEDIFNSYERFSETLEEMKALDWEEILSRTKNKTR